MVETGASPEALVPVLTLALARVLARALVLVAQLDSLQPLFRTGYKIQHGLEAAVHNFYKIYFPLLKLFMVILPFE